MACGQWAYDHEEGRAEGYCTLIHELICDIFEDTQKPLGEVVGNEDIGWGSQAALERLESY